MWEFDLANSAAKRTRWLCRRAVLAFAYAISGHRDGFWLEKQFCTRRLLTSTQDDLFLCSYIYSHIAWLLYACAYSLWLVPIVIIMS
jgi:hypothetical protein